MIRCTGFVVIEPNISKCGKCDKVKRPINICEFLGSRRRFIYRFTSRHTDSELGQYLTPLWAFLPYLAPKLSELPSLLPFLQGVFVGRNSAVEEHPFPSSFVRSSDNRRWMVSWPCVWSFHDWPYMACVTGWIIPFQSHSFNI